MAMEIVYKLREYDENMGTTKTLIETTDITEITSVLRSQKASIPHRDLRIEITTKSNGD